jgi:hypothetical protein
VAPATSRATTTKAGKRQQRTFATKSEGWAWIKPKVEEVEALRRGEVIPSTHRPQTVDELIDSFLERHGATVDTATKRKLERQLRHARKAFGTRHPDSLNRLEIEDWRGTLSPGSRHDVFRAFRQALAWAVARSLASRDASIRSGSGTSGVLSSRSRRGPRLKQSQRSSTRATGRSPSSRSARVYGLRNGSRSSAPTSTARPASCTCVVGSAAAS